MLSHSRLMQLALKQAERAMELGEVPIGAVIARGDEILAVAHNEIETRGDATAHAELLAIQEASRKLKSWRLHETVLCVTLEPCPMCAGAIRFSRVGTVVYGASDASRGGFGSLIDLSQDPRLGPVPNVISGIEDERARSLLQQFFKQAREK